MRGFNVQDFKSTIESKGGLLRNNRFLVSIPAPRKLVSPLGKDERAMELFCKSTPLPGIGILTQDVYRYGYGPIERMPYGTVFNDAMLEFYVDSSGMVRKWFRQWVTLITNPSMPEGIKSKSRTTGNQAYEFAYKEDYQVDIRITAFNSEGQPAINVILCAAYPNYIGETHQNWDDKNSNMITSVSFTYRDWYEEFPTTRL